jgi:hypothetical protein
MKRDTVRLKDRADAEMLLRRFRTEAGLMPLRKFRHVEDMTPPPWRTPGDPALERAIAFVLTSAARMSRIRFPPGVYRHRSIEEMNALQMEWRRVGRSEPR